MKRIATHKNPDADAQASLWLAERFLFADEPVEIVFVGRGVATDDADCVVDTRREHDPARLRFDHKSPAFKDRNASCAARLLWDHLSAMGKPVAYLADWIAVVHEGDANPPRSPSPELTESRITGYHRVVANARWNTASDLAAYEVVRAWLDARFGNENAPVPPSGTIAP